MPGGRLPENANQRICQISGHKRGRGRSRKSEKWSPTREFFEIVFEFETKPVIYKVASYKRWSLTRSGRYSYERELTVP